MSMYPRVPVTRVPLCLLVVLTVIGPAVPAANIITVAPTGGDCDCVQTAVQNAYPGDVIEIHPGT